MVGVLKGTVVGVEILLVLSCLVFGAGALVTLLLLRRVPLQNVATASTVFFALYLGAGAIIAIAGDGAHLDFFIYLVWFFPLLAFNKLVNAPLVGRMFARVLGLAPLAIIAALWPRLAVLFSLELRMLTVASALSYVCYAFMLDAASKYREEYIVERERAESLRIESELLESISDCFISLDTDGRLVYLNDAACAEFGVERRAALTHTLPIAVPAFWSQSMSAGLRVASEAVSSSTFEAQNQSQTQWYEMRCFPRADGLSLYFRNVTAATLSRRNLDEAHDRLREQADLLDKAQDAILVVALDSRLIYWNKGAERLYGWTALEVKGRLAADLFADGFQTRETIATAVLQYGEWDGEITQRRRDGSLLIVESRCTLVSSGDGTPHSILSINTDITNRKAAEAKVERLAFYDVLTELPNRVLLRERLERALGTAVERGSMGALLVVDVDDFKTVNDTLGHDAGDLLLKAVARRLAGCVRSSDTVARFGDDEFVVMLEGLSDDPQTAAAETKMIADKILGAFLAPYRLATHDYAGTASIGITLFPGQAGTAEDLLKRADLAMYRAKARGRNSMSFFDPAMETFVALRVALESDLRHAVANHEFELYYQPQVDGNGRVLGAEALLRWRHATRGMVSPVEFIPLAESTGLILELGRWALETACMQLAAWASRPETASLTIAVNVSLRQFNDPNFVALVLDELRASGANPRLLKLEITESSVMDNAEDTIAKMSVLKEHLVGFSLDDFGTGYSSLSHLKRIPLDQLKIDRSFVCDVLTDIRGASIARTIITLGANLNIAVIAEGVETEGQREFLAREGCHTYQGFLFSPALPAAKFEAFVAAGAARTQTVGAA